MRSRQPSFKHMSSCAARAALMSASVQCARIRGRSWREPLRPTASHAGTVSIGTSCNQIWLCTQLSQTVASGRRLSQLFHPEIERHRREATTPFTPTNENNLLCQRSCRSGRPSMRRKHTGSTFHPHLLGCILGATRLACITSPLLGSIGLAIKLWASDKYLIAPETVHVGDSTSCSRRIRRT